MVYGQCCMFQSYMFRSWFKNRWRIKDRLTNFLVPSQCLMCPGTVDRDAFLCSSCWPGVPWVQDPMCFQCGYPLPYHFVPDDKKSWLCGACMVQPKQIIYTRSALVYGETSKSLILKLKYADYYRCLPLFGAWLYQAGQQDIAGASLWNQVQTIIPVPLHWRRRIMRQYNQAELLAVATMKHAQSVHHLGFPTIMIGGLVRTRHTPPLGQASPTERRSLLKNCFAVPSKFNERLKGQSVVLVDDVMTSGSTLEACANVLLKSGVKKVCAITLARAVLHHQDHKEV